MWPTPRRIRQCSRDPESSRFTALYIGMRSTRTTIAYRVTNFDLNPLCHVLCKDLLGVSAPAQKPRVAADEFFATALLRHLTVCDHDTIKGPFQNTLQRVTEGRSITHQEPLEERGRQPPVGSSEAENDASERRAAGAHIER